MLAKSLGRGYRSGGLEGEVGSGQWGRCSTRTQKEQGFKYLALPCELQ